jgi:hypothetical protein
MGGSGEMFFLLGSVVVLHPGGEARLENRVYFRVAQIGEGLAVLPLRLGVEAVHREAICLPRNAGASASMTGVAIQRGTRTSLKRFREVRCAKVKKDGIA